MWVVRNDEEMKEVEKSGALVGVFVDRAYSREKIEWLLEAKEGFDQHAGDAFHLLVPVKDGYGIDTVVDSGEYNVERSGHVIEQVGIKI
jgi:microsomal dipeptidase-like Zn-dependent dipeptidase